MSKKLVNLDKIYANSIIKNCVKTELKRLLKEIIVYDDLQMLKNRRIKLNENQTEEYWLVQCKACYWARSEQ